MRRCIYIPLLLVGSCCCCWSWSIADDVGVGSFTNVSASPVATSPPPPAGGNSTASTGDECNRRCERRIRPLCGSDGVTYENECSFECARHRLPSSSAELKLRYRGICCPPAQLCAPYVRRVCDEHGMVYENDCIFNHRQCVLQLESGRMLRMAWITPSGDCPLNATNTLRQVGPGPNRNSTLPLSIKPASIRTEAGRQCSFFCDEELQPLCDSRGGSHKNFCKFALANCRLTSRGLPALQVEHAEECVERSTEEPSGKRVEATDRIVHLALPSIDAPTPMMPLRVNPIIRLKPESPTRRTSPLSTRANGKAIMETSLAKHPMPLTSFPEEAMMSMESGEDVFENDTSGAVESSKPSSLKSTVPATSTPQPPTTTTTTTITFTSSSTVSSKLPGPVCSAALCDKSWSPVCDVRGVTHRNECLFHFHLCKAKSGAVKGMPALRIEHVGVCDEAAREQPGSNLTAGISTTVALPPPTPSTSENAELDCDGICGEEGEGEEEDTVPVCDNTNRTHQSICLFAQWNCERVRVGREERVLVHVGPCHALSPLFDLKSEGCPMKCSKHYKPVCDTQGVTHPNLCAFQKHNCHMRQAMSKDGGGGAGARPGWLRSLRACGEKKDSRILRYLT